MHRSAAAGAAYFHDAGQVGHPHQQPSVGRDRGAGEPHGQGQMKHAVDGCSPCRGGSSNARPASAGSSAMRRADHAHLLRAATRIADDPHILVIGPQAILGTYGEDELPQEAWLAVEADLAFVDDPASGKADQVDGASASCPCSTRPTRTSPKASTSPRQYCQEDGGPRRGVRRRCGGTGDGRVPGAARPGRVQARCSPGRRTWASHVRCCVCFSWTWTPSRSELNSCPTSMRLLAPSCSGGSPEPSRNGARSRDDWRRRKRADDAGELHARVARRSHSSLAQAPATRKPSSLAAAP